MIDHPYQIADLAVTVAVLQCKNNSAERHSGNGRSTSHNTADYLDIAVVVVARRHRCPRLRRRRRRPRLRPRHRPCRPRLRNLHTQQQQQRAECRVAPSALLPSALPSCAANVAAVADADGAAKWRADAAADGRAFVTLVSAADAAAECCLSTDQADQQLFAVFSGYGGADTSRIL